VYQALLNPKKHAEFTGAGATGSPRVGGKFTAWDGYISGRNLELEPPGRIVQEWTTTEWPAESPPSKLEWTFVQKKAGTQVTMVHSNVPASQAESYRKGWVDFYFDPLKKYFAAKAV
jgi:activator of HSP90 ATPase